MDREQYRAWLGLAVSGRFCGPKPLHECRHTHASLLMAAGSTVEALMAAVDLRGRTQRREPAAVR